MVKVPHVSPDLFRSHSTDLLFGATDADLDLHDTQSSRQGSIKVRLSLVNHGVLIANSARQLAFNMLRGADTAAEGYLNVTSSNWVQIPRDVVAQPILDVLDKLNHFMQIAEEIAKVKHSCASEGVRLLCT